MLLHAEKHFASKTLIGSAKGALALVVGFGSLTAWNMIGTHAGLSEIDHRAVAAQRAPLEQAATRANAEAAAARSNLETFDSAADAQDRRWESALRGFNSNYVSATTRSLGAADQEAQARIARRTALTASEATAIAAREAAQLALTNGPARRDDSDLWVATIVLELLKGALVWLATAGERRRPSARSRERHVSELNERELEEMMARGGSMVSTARWERARRLRAA